MNQEFLERLLALFDEFGIDPGAVDLPEPTDGPFGFSPETTEYGGRSHPLVDDFIATASNADQYGKEIAEDMPRFFVVNPGRFPEMQPDDTEKAKLAQKAYARKHISLAWLSNDLRVMVGNYGLRLDEPRPEENLYFKDIDSHGVLYVPTNMTPDLAIRAYVDERQRQLERLRENGRPFDWYAQ